MGFVNVEMRVSKTKLVGLLPGEIFRIGTRNYIIIEDNKDDNFITSDFDKENFYLVLELNTFRIDTINKNTIVIPQEADLIIRDSKEVG